MKEWDENKLDQELEALLNEIPEQDELEKRIEKYINRRISRIVHKTLAMIVAVVILLLAIINPILKMSFINPNKDPYFDVMRDYYETTRPYVELIAMAAESKGFARYEITMQVTNHRENLIMGKSNVWFDLNCGKMTDLNDAQWYLINYMGRFDNHLHMEGTTWIEETMDELKKLPDSANIYLSLYTAEPQTIEELRDSDIKLEWLEVYQPNVEYRGGLNMDFRAAHDETDLRDEMSETELISVYCDNLKNLLDHKEMWKEHDLPGATMIYGDESVLEDTYKDALELTELKTERFTIYGEKTDIIEYLEKTEIVSIHVDEITLY